MAIFIVVAAAANGVSAQGASAVAGTATASEDTAAPSPAAQLAEILRDPTARDALIAELEQASSAASDQDGDAGAAIAAPPDIDPLSLGRELADITQAAAEGTVRQAAQLWRAVVNAPTAFDGLTGAELGVVLEALKDLLPVIAVTLGCFFLLRFLATPLYRRLGTRARNGGALQRSGLFLAAGAIDLGIVLLAWAVGYAAGTTVLGEFGRIGLLQTLYLNAFLAVGLVKMLVRLVLSPTTADLRPLPIADKAATYLTRRASLLVNLLGYGEMLLLPVININVSRQAGQAVSTLISVVAILVVTGIVIAKRRAVADWLMAQMRPVSQPNAAPERADTANDNDAPAAAPEPEPAPRSGTLQTLARSWHWFALVYLACVLVLILARPGPFVFDVLIASGQVIAALVIGLLISGALSRGIGTGVRLPQSLNEKMPMLESRLNMLVPQLLWLLRAGILLALALFTIAQLGLFGIGDALRSELGLRLTGSALSVGLILLAAGAIWLAMNAWIDHRLNPAPGLTASPREQTLLTLLRNAGTIAILLFTTMFALSEIGLNIGPLLASAGVVGLAIGFGAQKMVQDIITGVFLQFERAINVGDVVTAGGITGGVEKMTVRSVSLRDLDGIYHVIPFSSVDAVSNFTRGFAYYVIDMGIAYRENVSEAKQAMFDAFDELTKDPEQRHFLTDDELEWFGLDAFGDNAVILKARIRTLPGKQWGVGRAYNEIIKRVFDERGIEIPFPHRTIYLGESKDGTTQAVRFAPVTTEPLAAPDRAAE